MKKFMSLLLALVFAAGLAFFAGCGGGGQQVNSAADEEGQVMDEASQQKKEELPTTYMVEEGDTLYSIAEKAEIYGNKYQWPLIYDANRDILDDYKVITEGQKLIIPRNVSAVEIEAAKQKAQELGWPSGSGTRVAGAKHQEEEEEGGEESQVAGMGSKGGDTASGEAGETAMTETSPEENPTPIPVKGQGKKQGKGNNTIWILLAVIGIIIIAVIFIMSQRKKKDEDEDGENKEDKSDNILG